jgi:hypothetical protein
MRLAGNAQSNETPPSPTVHRGNCLMFPGCGRWAGRQKPFSKLVLRRHIVIFARMCKEHKRESYVIGRVTDTGNQERVQGKIFMNLMDFFTSYLFKNMNLYFTILLPVALLFAVIYKKLIINNLEIIILSFCYFGVVFSVTDVIFLYMLGLIKYVYYINFLVTTGIFYITLLFFNKKLKLIFKTKENKPCHRHRSYAYIFSLICIVLYIALNILRIKFIGVRTAEIKGGGTGSIIRILSIISSAALFSVFFVIFNGTTKEKLLIIPLFFGPYIYFSLLGISKSAFIGILINLYLFLLLNIGNKQIISRVKKITIPLLIFGIIGGIVIVMQLSSQTALIALSLLGQRFVAFGDVYIYAYPNGNIENIETHSFLNYLFGDMLATFRLVSYDHVNNIPGELMNIVYGPGTSGGPNPRFNITGYALWGFWGSLPFSLFCAVIFIASRYFVFRSINSKFFTQLFAFFIFSSLGGIEQDANILSKFFPGFIMLFIFITIIDFCLSYCKPHKII